LSSRYYDALNSIDWLDITPDQSEEDYYRQIDERIE
jgi:hypothetical protein